MTTRSKDVGASSRPADSPRVISVLGMHRGGTSTAMRSLVCLGVDPGTDLLAGAPDENPLGFFEDGPLLEICGRVMERLGTKWDSPRLISESDWQQTAIGGLELEAIESIRTRFGGIPVWGFKNPRLARLLPFWQRVFKATGRRDSYLIVLRNPLSVSRSLAERNGISARTAHLLWLIHMTEAMVGTRGRPRICVDYDALLAEPETQLERVASAFDLPKPAENPDALERFVGEFLREDLRTTRFAASDLALEPDLSSLAERAYTLLRRWAKDDRTLSSRQLQRGFQEIHRQLQALAPVLSELDAVIEDRDQARIENIGYHDRIHLLQREAVDHEQDLSFSRERIEALEDAADVTRREIAQREIAMLDETRASATAREQVANLLTQLATASDEASVLALATSRERKDLERNLQRQSAERAELINEHGRERRRIEQRLRATLSEHETERALLSEGAERHRLAASVAIEASELLRTQLVDSRRESENLASAIATRQNEVVEWLHRETAISVSQLVDACRGLRTSRTWTLTAWIQRARERTRRRKWVDGSQHLQHLIDELYAQSQLRHVDVRFLANIAASAQVVLSQILEGRIFRSIRRLVSVKALFQHTRRTPGPVELLRHRVSEIAFFLQQLSYAPIHSSVAIPRQQPSDGQRRVDIIVPVYQARGETLRCLESVIRSENLTPFEIVVIDDASPDKRLRRSLEELSGQGDITLIRNEINLGFPATVNRGMELHADRDVVVLNSDTLVHGNWLDRLRRAALGDWKVATVTPFTNNGEICSYPNICQSQTLPTPEALAQLDDLASRTNDGLTATLPTAVGFCMYIRRAALKEVGDFDAIRFERGYGEENDFCMRARAHGYRNLLAADVVVGHEGGSSFGDARDKLIARGLSQLRTLHPGYEEEVHRFIDADPIRWLRQRMDIASLASESKTAILMVSHAQGGGTHRHVVDLSEHLESEGTPVFLLQPVSPTQAALTRFGAPVLPNLTFDLVRDFDRLLDLLRSIPIGHIHIHHLVGFHSTVRDLPLRLGLAYDVTVHDYFAICPRVHLVDDRDAYCGVPDAQTCTRCIQRNGGETGFDVDMTEWRTENSKFLAKARRVFVPSHDVRVRLEKIVPHANWKVRPHPEKPETSHSVVATRRKNRPLRVAVIGAIGLHKGSAALLECAIDARERGLPLEFHVIGFTDRDPELLATGKVSVTGPYEEKDLPGLMVRTRCQIAFIPSVWPETFCFTLSETIQGQLYPVAFDLGAVAERIRALDWGKLLALGTPASKVNDCLLALDPPPFPIESAEKIFRKTYGRFLSDYYDDLELR